MLNQTVSRPFISPTKKTRETAGCTSFYVELFPFLINSRVNNNVLPTRQKNIAKNANKFYIVQVLESDAGGGFVSWARWGQFQPLCSLIPRAHRKWPREREESERGRWTLVDASDVATHQ